MSTLFSSRPSGGARLTTAQEWVLSEVVFFARSVESRAGWDVSLFELDPSSFGIGDIRTHRSIDQNGLEADMRRCSESHAM